MGNRSLSISIAAVIALLSTYAPSCAQSTAVEPALPPPTAPAAIPKSSASTPAAIAKTKRAAPSTASSDTVGASQQIADRPPVKREVPPKPRRSLKGSGEQASSQPAGAMASGPGSPSVAVPANPATASDAAAASAGRKPWPVVVLPSHQGAGQPTAVQPGEPTWSDAEIQEARAHCASVLKGIDAGFLTEDPIRQGECGSPVVFKLTNIGKAPVVDVSPPVLLTCDMIAALDHWMKREVQPQARVHLGGPIIKLETMSSYSCRNAYGRAKTRLSEHGKANAIDIAGFATAKDAATVLAGWGPTLREQRAIAARLEAERAAQAQAQQNAVRAADSVSAMRGSTGGVIVSPGLWGAIPGVIVSDPASTFGRGVGLGFAPSRLGGPKTPELPPTNPHLGDADSKQKFLREIHTAACKYFGTVLGPEANNAHRNHFHLDMAQRKSSFCE